jgi:hypothetical protein
MTGAQQQFQECGLVRKKRMSGRNKHINAVECVGDVWND